ncbi:hypothetical protein OBV_12590 [Oscillibacter valericigenes Sjm18-20]|nr:hypothetical protein OBV_12590 [Oscillibacter valericigenes Sjm18-20]
MPVFTDPSLFKFNCVFGGFPEGFRGGVARPNQHFEAAVAWQTGCQIQINSPRLADFSTSVQALPLK